MREPSISHHDAKLICANAWPSEQAARDQAHALELAGWRVEWRRPPVQFGRSRRMIVATIYHPTTLDCPGDVTFRESSPWADAGRR